MTAARTRRASPAPRTRPQLVDPPTAPAVAMTSMAARRPDLVRELIATPCGRIVEREQAPLPAPAAPVDATPELQAWLAGRPRTSCLEHIYRLWEPVIDGNAYGVTRTAKDGKVWGLAHTRRAPRDIGFADAVKWEMAQQRRAMAAIVASCRELQGEHLDAPRRNCGVVSIGGSLPVLLANIEMAAREARAKR